MRTLTPYLNFDGNCREAMEFYQQRLGGKLNTMAFGEGGMEAPPGAEGRLIHARLESGGLVVMASDTMPGAPFQQGNNAWLNIECESDDEVNRLFAALGEGGRSVMEPQDTFWGARFGMLTDRWGVNWMLNFQKAPPPEALGEL